MSSLPRSLSFPNTVDGAMRLLVAIVAIGVLVLYSMPFEAQYSTKLIQLYMYPWWRFLAVLLVLCAAVWCPRAASLVALIVFFYLADMHTLLTPFASTEKAYA